MATYKEIQTDVKKHHDISIKTCWIAHVKEINGLYLKKAPNRISPSSRMYPCPKDVLPIIEESMKRFGMLH
jgi:hypothetical protein